jgi:FkbM family methyltransferase
MFLKSLGFKPRTILDIGAYQGDWAGVVHSVFPKAQLFMVEANEDKKEYLKILTWAKGFEIALLGDKKQTEVKYFLSKGANSTGNSIYKEKTTFFDNSNVRKVPMVTLDSVVKKRKLKNIDFVKIDTQGSELNILKGGKTAISKAEFVLLETQNLEYNLGAPFVDKVFEFMDKFGFALYDILEIHYLPSGEMMQIDFLFANKNSKYLKKGTFF